MSLGGYLDFTSFHLLVTLFSEPWFHLKFALSNWKKMSNNTFWEIDIGGTECIAQLQTVNIHIQNNMSCLYLFFIVSFFQLLLHCCQFWLCNYTILLLSSSSSSIICCDFPYRSLPRFKEWKYLFLSGMRWRGTIRF
jgi:hypothetical protein